jgi:predicted amidohydrolase
MKDTIKISAVNSENNILPDEANPYSRRFIPDALKNYVDNNLEKMLAYLHEAGKNGVDLVCTYEDFLGQGYSLRLDDQHLFRSQAVGVPDPTCEKIGAIAKRYEMHVAANLYEKDGDRIYNTTVLFGRNGKIIGKYRKIHMPVCEKWHVARGHEFSVFDTDIGRIGFAVCYDIVFLEHCRAMALNGADIILHPTGGMGISGVSSSYIGEALLRVRAAENAVYLVVAKNTQFGGQGRSCIIDNNGEILAELQGRNEGITTAEFRPDFDIVREDLFDTFFSGVSNIRARQTIEREPSLYSILAERNPPLYSRYKDVKLSLEPNEIKEISNQWKEYVQADIEKRPVNLKYHW